MDNATTIVYYSSNREDEDFENKVRERILGAKGDVPLISVSQKPIDFGINICVGEVGVCEDNLFRQMLVGCQRATTPLVTFCEADTLYPPTYFTTRPEDLTKRYWIENVWILYKTREGFWNKGRSDCGHIAGREFMISVLERRLANRTPWVCHKALMPRYNRKTEWPEKIELKTAIISLKTGNGMRPSTQTWPIPKQSLNFWGRADNLKKKFFE